MTPDPRLETDLRALAASLRQSADFADRVIAHLPPPRRSRLTAPVLARVGCLGAFALLFAATVGLYMLARAPHPRQDPNTAQAPPAAPEVKLPTPTPPPAVGFSTRDFAYSNSKWGFIDRTGKVVVPARYSRVGEFSGGLAPVKVDGTYAAGSKGKWGFIDRTGKEVIAPRFDWALPFREGRAGVQVGDKWGFIDTTGELVITPQFESVGRFSEGLAAVCEKGLNGFVGPGGEYRIRPRFASADSFSEGLAVVRVNDTSPWQYIDRTGATALTLDPDIERAFGFAEERAPVSIGGKWGAIDRSGKLVVEPRYDQLDWFVSGRARVSVRRSVEVNGSKRSIGTKSGYIAADGTELGPLLPDYENLIEIDPVTGELTAVELNAALEPVRVSAIDFTRLRSEDGLYRAWMTDRRGTMTYHTNGFVDRQGRVVIPPTLEDVGHFREGLAPFAVGLDWEAAARQRRHR